MYTPIDIKRNSKFGSNYWEVYSHKVKRIVKFFSDLEYEHWVLIETNPNIKTFCEQPLKIKQVVKGKIVVTIFDMWVLYEDSAECFIEVKYYNELQNDGRSSRATEAQKLWCQENKFLHSVITEKEIRKNPIYLENMKIILSQIKNQQQPTESEVLQIKKVIQDDKKRIQDIQDSLSNISPIRIREIISWLIYQGLIGADIDKTILSNKTEVWISK